MAWNQSTTLNNAPRKPSKPAPSWVKGALAGLLVVVLLGIAAFFIFGVREEAPKEEKVEKKSPVATLEEVKPAAAPKPVELPKEEDPAKKARREKLAKMTPEERLDFIFEEMKQKPIDLTPKTNQTFNTGTEQILSWIFTCKVGDMPPPLPNVPIRDEAHMAEILMADNPVLEGDSESVRDAKAVVEEAKKELRAYIKEGGSVQDFLSHYRGELVKSYNEWKMSQQSVMQVVRETPEIAGEYIKKVNMKLAQKGIKPVVIPTKLRESIGDDE